MEPELGVVMESRETGMGRRIVFLAAGAALLLMACRGEDDEKGRISLSLGDYPMAIGFFRAAVEEDPHHYDARLGLGQALLQKAFAEDDSASFEYALIQLEACRGLAPSQDISELLADAYYERARSLLRNRDTVAALATLSKAIDRAPENTRPLNLVGIVYGKLGETGKAEALFRQALISDASDPSANFNLGMILWQSGDVRLAHAHWLKALKAMPRDEDVLYWFALSEKKLRETP